MEKLDADAEWDIAMAAVEEADYGAAAYSQQYSQHSSHKLAKTKSKRADDLDMVAQPKLGKLTSKASIKSKSSVHKEEEPEDDGWGDDDDGGDQWGGSDDDEDAWAESEQISELKKGESEVVKGPYKVLTLKDIEDQIPKHVKLAQDLLCIENNDEVIAILRHFEWSQQKLEDTWFAADQDKLRTEIGLVFDKELRKSHKDIDATLAGQNNNMCAVMYMEFDSKDADYKALQLPCGHQFSAIAWTYYLQEKVQSKGQACVFTRCQQTYCNMLVPHSMFLQLLQDQPEFPFRTKYLTWHYRQFTDNNKSIKWCPNKKCSNLVEISEYCSLDSVKCTCGITQCIRCSEEAHMPASCNHVFMWLEKEKSDSENLGWIKANTKPCPKCGSSIEKNQGCNHMNCSKCKHDFCWLCLTPWKEHGSKTGGYYSCNLYETRKEKDENFAKAENSQEEAKNELQRYMFHFERYNNHGKSMKNCVKKMDQIRDTMKLLHEVKKYPNSELEFFQQAANSIIICRAVLKYTYVTGYFMESKKSPYDKGVIQLFKYQQTLLEEACEQTHQKLESDISPFLDELSVDRSPFYNFKSELVTLNGMLIKQYESFSKAITMEDLKH